jgi:luciferase family oxidoreductase group 1
MLLSVLDLSPIPHGKTAREALLATLDLAQHCERWGYHRFWLAEHHNLPGVASAATALVIGQVAALTSRMRVGAGGIMLPNHAPLLIAEQFGTLESLFPGRIDLALGRAPGSDPLTQRALRVDPSGAERFPDDVLELQAWFQEPSPQQTVRAVPGAGLAVPLWILGSSLYGAQLAAALGLPYAFASHFAPQQLVQACQLYRARFQPSAQQATSHLMLALNVVAADSEEEARVLYSSLQQAFVNLRRGQPGQLPPPDPDFEARLAPPERALLAQTLACSVVGSPETVRAGIRRFAEQHGADELIVSCPIFEHGARLRSLEIASSLI